MKNEPKILCFTVLIALFLHAGAIFLLKEVKVNFYSTSHSWMEHQGVAPSQESLGKEEKFKREQQIAALFKEIKQKPSQDQALKYGYNQFKPELANLKVSIDLDFRHDSAVQPLSIPADELVFADAAMPELKQAPANVRQWEVVSQADHPHIADELMKATEMLKGDLGDLTPESLQLVHTIKAGAIDHASLEGNALKSQQGFIDQGNPFAPHPASSVSGISMENPRKVQLERDQTGNASSLLPGEYGTIASSSDFFVRVEYCPKRTEAGYIFRLELVPKEGVVFKRIKQNLFFLVDRSHSIRERRYEATKEAVLQALKLLHPGDTFNILVFDNKISRLSKQNLPWTSGNVNQAAEFLSNQQYGGFFATTDLYTSMGNIVPEAVAANEVNTAILLSDGDTYLKADKQRETINKWTEKNSGKVSLYSLASGEGNNLPLLDVLSTFNKGTLHYAETDDNLEKALLALMKSIRNPIGKNISVTAISPEKGVHIKINPDSSLLPNLYEETPYVVFGTINQLVDFPIFFQGRYYDKWLDIKQVVSFKGAAVAKGAALERMWAVQQAYDDYAGYLKDGNRGHLVHARQILAPYRIATAFDP